MIYFLPLIFLSLFAILENIDKFNDQIKNKYFYLFLSIFFIFFVGLRHEVGCDWESFSYHFQDISSSSLINLLKKNDYDIGHSMITKLISIKFNYNIFNLIYALFFVVPLFIFSYKIKRTFLSLVIAYPYYIVVIGMGPIRQAVCISFLFLSLIFINNKKYWISDFLSIFSSLMHISSTLINGIIFLNLIPLRNKNYRIYQYVFISLTFMLFIFNYQFIFDKLHSYIFLYKDAVNPAKSAFIVWFINLIPAIIFLKYKNIL